MKQFKPTTPSLRHRIIVPSLPSRSFKPLTHGLAKSTFRNNQGRITIRHRGGGHKRNYRVIDFLRLNSRKTPFKVVRIEYDPNRSAFIALCQTIKPYPIKSKNLISAYTDNYKYFYILAPGDINPGDIIETGKIGSAQPLEKFLIGQTVYNIEGKYVRSAGTFATIIKFDDRLCWVKLTSGEIKSFDKTSVATLGRVSNINHNLEILGKAGVSRWLGHRPVVRGEVMNPIDHPHGGKTRGGRPLKNIWGQLAKWTRLHKK